MLGEMDIWKRRMNNMANTQYMDLLREILEENEDGYGVIEVDGDGYNEYVFIWEGYSKKIAEFNELCKAKLKANGIDTYPDYDYDNYYIDFATGDNWEYYDSIYICSECYKAYRLEQGYGYNEYFIGDGYIICPDCVKESYKEEYIDELIDNPRKANLIFTDAELEEEGFELVNKDHHYANGWYGQTDSPTEIYEELKSSGADIDVIFSIHKNYNPWETEFDVYVRSY